MGIALPARQERGSENWRRWVVELVGWDWDCDCWCLCWREEEDSGSGSLLVVAAVGPGAAAGAAALRVRAGILGRIGFGVQFSNV